MGEGQSNEKTKEFSPEELEKPEKGLSLDASKKPMKIEVEEIPLEELFSDKFSFQDKIDTQKMPRLEETQILPPGYKPPFADPRGIRINPDAEQETVRIEPLDKDEHKITKTKEREYGTSIWKLGDVRESKPVIFHGYEALPWAVARLVRETNEVIDQGKIPGNMIQEGDTVQICVVSYYDGAVQKPRTTPNSPKYAALPYKLIRAKEGNLSAEPAISGEAKIHFTIPKIVGDLVPLAKDLKPEEKEGYRSNILVTLQLKEAVHKIERGDLEEIIRKPLYETTLATEEAKIFIDFIKQEQDGKKTPAYQKPAPKKLSERLSSRDQQNFGFR